MAGLEGTLRKSLLMDVTAGHMVEEGSPKIHQKPLQQVETSKIDIQRSL